MTEIITRQNYARLFDGVFKDMANTIEGDLIAAVFDRVYMPSLVAADGKSLYQSFTLLQNVTQTLEVPQLYVTSKRLYVAILTNGRVRVNYNSPTHGNTKKVLLEATNTTALGVHNAFWTYQGDISAISVTTPSTADGGTTTEVNVFMYEIPDLALAASYFDRQIGLGVT